MHSYSCLNHLYLLKSKVTQPPFYFQKACIIHVFFVSSLSTKKLIKFHYLLVIFFYLYFFKCYLFHKYISLSPNIQKHLNIQTCYATSNKLVKENVIMILDELNIKKNIKHHFISFFMRL